MLAGLSSHISLDQSEAPELSFEDFATLLQTLFPGASHIGFYDSNGRSRWVSDAGDTPDLAIRVAKLLLQASANIQDCFAEKTKTGSAHIFAVRGPDDSLRGAVAFSLTRSGYGRKSRRLRPHVIEATVTPLLRILGRALQAPEKMPMRIEAVATEPVRTRHDPFVGAAARAMSAPVVMRRAVSAAINTCNCAFGAMITVDRQHTVIVRGADEHVPQADMRHIVDALRESICSLASVDRDGSLAAASTGAADFQTVAFPAYASDGRSSAVLVLFRRHNDVQFDAATRACVRDIALRIAPNAFDQLSVFAYSGTKPRRPEVHAARDLVATPVLERSEPTAEDRVRAALRHDHFELHAQSIVPLAKASETRRCELLLRLKEEHSLQLPHEFLEVADREALLPDIDRWVVGRLIQILRSRPELIRDEKWEFAVNISGASLQRATFGDFIETQLFRHDIPPQALVFEFSEADVLTHLSMFEQLAPRLVALGCRVAIDNCRQGLDVFLSIGRLPVHRLKIDAALTHHVASDRRAAHAVRELVEVARDVDIETVGEHVEDELTCQALRELGVDFAQGFTIAKPQPFKDLFC